MILHKQDYSINISKFTTSISVWRLCHIDLFHFCMKIVSYWFVSFLYEDCIILICFILYYIYYQKRKGFFNTCWFLRSSFLILTRTHDSGTCNAKDIGVWKHVIVTYYTMYYQSSQWAPVLQYYTIYYQSSQWAQVLRYYTMYYQSSQWVPVLRSKTSKTLFESVNFSALNSLLL